jgi:hypothetical protein
MAAQNRVQTSAQETTRSAREPVPENKDAAKFAEPRGWALKWDGFALSMMGEQRNGRTSTPAA